MILDGSAATEVIMLTETELDSLKAEYTPEQLMGIVRQARHYLRDYTGGGVYNNIPVEVDLYRWGTLTKDGTYTMCFAGLWYLLETGGILKDLLDRHNKLSPVTRFLNGLRFPRLVAKDVAILLGVDLSKYTYEEWNAYDPQCILTFLDWLVTQSQRQ